MSNELDGMRYDRDMRMYVPETVGEERDSFTLVQSPTRIDGSAMPSSPKSLWKLASSLDWMVSCWVSLATVAPTLYMSSSDEGSKTQYSAGDVRFDGYNLTIYTVESREPLLPIGFKAQFVGKSYGDGDKRNTAGSFEYALLADPVGCPTGMRFGYEAVKLLRGEREIEKFYQRRVMDAERDALRMNREYNDGAYWMNTRPMITAAKPLLAWLGQWGNYGKLSHKNDRAFS